MSADQEDEPITLTEEWKQAVWKQATDNIEKSFEARRKLSPNNHDLGNIFQVLVSFEIAVNKARTPTTKREIANLIANNALYFLNEFKQKLQQGKIYDSEMQKNEAELLWVMDAYASACGVSKMAVMKYQSLKNSVASDNTPQIP